MADTDSIGTSLILYFKVISLFYTVNNLYFIATLKTAVLL